MALIFFENFIHGAKEKQKKRRSPRQIIANKG
jgi:hypothetical protein